ncbi:MAG: hypothetical protein ACXW1N_08255 [Halobacteriota archaeon]
MSATTLLDNYTNAKHAIEDHIEKHKDIFNAHQQIVFRLIDAEEALREAVDETGEEVSNGEYRVTITPQENEVCNFEKLDELIATKQIPDIRNLIVQKNVRRPRITISPVR